jgi:hypothetical protein
MSTLKDWRSHPQDYIVICNTLNAVDGEGVVGYHIFNITAGISHIIESQSMVRKLAQEMLDAGVRLVTMDEAMRIIYRDRPHMYEHWRQKTGKSGA